MIQGVRALGIGGSPRRGGNTDRLLDEALAGATSAGAETSKIVLNELVFRPCQACGGCEETGRCIIADGMADVYRDVLTSDGIILASPLYFSSVSAQTKMMVDRFHCEWVRRFVIKSALTRTARGIFLCAAHSEKEADFECARKVARVFFKSIGIGYAGECICGGAAEKGVIVKQTEAMRHAFELGQSLITGAGVR